MLCSKPRLRRSDAAARFIFEMRERRRVSTLPGSGAEQRAEGRARGAAQAQQERQRERGAKEAQ